MTKKNPTRTPREAIQATLADVGPVTRARWTAALQLLEEMEMDNGAAPGDWCNRANAKTVQDALRRDIHLGGDEANAALQQAALGALDSRYDEGEGDDWRSGYEILACPVDPEMETMEDGRPWPSYTLRYTFAHTCQVLDAIFDS